MTEDDARRAELVAALVAKGMPRVRAEEILAPKVSAKPHRTYRGKTS